MVDDSSGTEALVFFFPVLFPVCGRVDLAFKPICYAALRPQAWIAVTDVDQTSGMSTVESFEIDSDGAGTDSATKAAAPASSSGEQPQQRSQTWLPVGATGASPGPASRKSTPMNSPRSPGFNKEDFQLLKDLVSNLQKLDQKMKTGRGGTPPEPAQDATTGSRGRFDFSFNVS